MGNCCTSQSSVVWAGDDWGSVAPEIRRSERESLLGGERSEGGLTTSSSSSTSGREVKIKITKRELEELMARVDMQGLSMEELLARLMNTSDKFEMEHHHHLHLHKHWKPALQSIPEVN